jgi:hypothetical protein
MRAKPFSFEVSETARSVEPEKFVRPDLSGTRIGCHGLTGRKHINKMLINSKLQKTHDSEAEKSFKSDSKISPFHCAPVEMTKEFNPSGSFHRFSPIHRKQRQSLNCL